MSLAWVAFARDGTPDHAELTPWPAYTETAERATMILDNECRVEHDPYREQRRAWEGAPGQTRTSTEDTPATERADHYERCTEGNDPEDGPVMQRHGPLGWAVFGILEPTRRTGRGHRSAGTAGTAARFSFIGIDLSPATIQRPANLAGF